MVQKVQIISNRRRISFLGRYIIELVYMDQPPPFVNTNIPDHKLILENYVHASLSKFEQLPNDILIEYHFTKQKYYVLQITTLHSLNHDNENFIQ